MKKYKSIFKEVKVNPQIDTPEFKKWFGKSKVVESGKPLVVYHGTNQKFDVFSKTNTRETSGDYVGEGYFFAKKIQTAKNYGPLIKSVYLKITKPIIINNKLDGENLYNLISDNFNYDELKKAIGEEKEKVDEMISVVGKQYIYFALKKKNPSAIKNKLRKLGYDGLIDNVYGQYAVFNPNQIKSVIDD